MDEFEKIDGAQIIRSIDNIDIEHMWRGNHQTLAISLARYLFLSKFLYHQRILDVGCGSGYGSELLSRAGNRVIGIDKSSQLVTIAAQSYPHRIFIQRDFMKDNLDDLGKFDAVVAMIGFNNWDDLNTKRGVYDALYKCKDLLIGNGVFATYHTLSVPMPYDLKDVITRVFGICKTIWMPGPQMTLYDPVPKNVDFKCMVYLGYKKV